MNRFKRILCVIDPAIVNVPALERAVTLAEENQASLTVVTTIDPIAVVPGIPDGCALTTDIRTKIVCSYAQALEIAVAPYCKRIEIQTRVLVGVPFLEIIRNVLRDGNDLVIKIPEPADWLDRSFGSNDLHLLRKCPCTLWLTKPRGARSYRRIMAAVDVGGKHPQAELTARHTLDRQILEIASSLAFSDSAELHVVHAWNAIGESTLRGAMVNTPEDEIHRYIEHVRQWHASSLDALMREVNRELDGDTADYLTPRTHLLKGRAHTKVPSLAKRVGIDLVVMGTVARTGVPGFLIGNTAETILSQIDCSVLAIKPPGFVTPVTLAD